jgi:hypothetical protein
VILTSPRERPRSSHTRRVCQFGGGGSGSSGERRLVFGLDLLDEDPRSLASADPGGFPERIAACATCLGLEPGVAPNLRTPSLPVGGGRAPDSDVSREGVQRDLMRTVGVELEFTDDAIAAIARMAAKVDGSVENIGARRLQTVMERCSTRSVSPPPTAPARRCGLTQSLWSGMSATLRATRT